MKIKHFVPGLALAVALVPAGAAVAQKPAKPPKPPKPAPGSTAITFDAKPTTIVFASPTTLSGRLSANTAGVTVKLEEDTTRPYGDSYKPSDKTTTTANNGSYSFSVKPGVNTQYRAVAQASPTVTSAPKLVLVRMLVGLRVSDSTPRRGSRVRFSGTVFPAHDGRTASIQKRSATGRFVTVARATLRDAGTARSSYAKSIRIFRGGVYRVKVVGDSDHINGFSRLKTITVG